jgi:hypothetical protein
MGPGQGQPVEGEGVTFEFRALEPGEHPLRVTACDDPSDEAILTLVVEPAELPDAPPPAPSRRRAFRFTESAPAPGGYQDLAWDKSTHTLVAAQRNQIVRLFPASGRRELLAELNWGEGDLPPRPENAPTSGPWVEDLCLDPRGGVFFTLSLGDGFPLPQVWRLDPARGSLARIAGPISPSRAGAPPSPGRAQDALAVRLNPADLAAGADGACYVADQTHGRVLELFPRDQAGYGVRVIAGLGTWVEDRLDLQERDAVLGDQDDALEALLDPIALAVFPDGSLAVADERHDRVCRLSRHAGRDAGHWSVKVLAAAGREDPARPGMPYPTGTPFQHLERVAVAEDGTVYAMDSLQVWEIPGAAGDRLAAPCRVVAGPGHGLPWRSGDPAERLEVGGMTHLAAAPGGGLLLTGAHIHYLTAEGDTALGEKVQELREGRAAGGDTIRFWLGEWVEASWQARRDPAGATVRTKEAAVLRAFQTSMALAAAREGGTAPGPRRLAAAGAESKHGPAASSAVARKPAVPARKGFQPGEQTRIPLQGLVPQGLACLDGESVCILDRGRQGLEPGARQGAPAQESRLLLARRLRDPQQWFVKVLHATLPPGCRGLAPGPGPTLTVALADGGYQRLHLARAGAGWRVLDTRELLTAQQRQGLGLGERDAGFLVTREGALVLSQGRTLIWPLGTDPDRPGRPRLLLFPPAEAGEGKEPKASPLPEGGTGSGAPAPEPDLVLAAAADGRVLALDPSRPAAILVDPGGLGIEHVQVTPGWLEGLVPEAASGCADLFALSGRRQGESTSTLLTLGPRTGGSGPWPLIDLGVRVEPGAALAFSPEGHLLACEPARAALLKVRDRVCGQDAAPDWSRLQAADVDGDLPFVVAMADWRCPGGALPELLPGGFTPALERWKARLGKWGPGPAPTPAAGLSGLATAPDPADAALETVHFSLSSHFRDLVARWMWRHADQANGPRGEIAWVVGPERRLVRHAFGRYRDRHRVILEFYSLEPYALRIDPRGLLAMELAGTDGCTGFTVSPDGTPQAYGGLVLVLDTKNHRIEALRPGGRLVPMSPV